MVRMLCRAAAAVLVLLGQPSWAEDVRITADLAAKQIVVNGQTLEIARIQDKAHMLTGEFTKTSRACPPFLHSPNLGRRGCGNLGRDRAYRVF